MDWKSVDERLIRRGEILLSLDFLENYEDELRAMNREKVGRPYTLPERYMEFLSVVRYLFVMPYRQLEGFTRALNRANATFERISSGFIPREYTLYTLQRKMLLGLVRIHPLSSYLLQLARHR